MTPRSIRRAAERQAMKAARKAERFLVPESHAAEVGPEPSRPTPSTTHHLARPELKSRELLREALCWHCEPSDDSPAEPLLFTPSPLSAAQLAANRSNAQLSPGPTTPEGKAKSSLNAVKTALTGRTILLPTDDTPEYERHVAAYAEDFRPLGPRESDLVQSIADTTWRLQRIPRLETAIFAQGYIEFGEAFNQHDAPLRASMIEVQTFFKYEKQLRNLQLQEARLARRREKEITELRQLQAERRQREMQALETVSSLYLIAKEANLPFEPAADGFVFSIPQIEQHLQRVHARNMSRVSQARVFNPASQPERTTQRAA